MPNQAAPSQKVKKRRSLIKPEKRAEFQNSASKRVLPVNVESADLDDIMTRIATGQESNPQQAFAKIYSLALDAIADTLKSSLVSLVQSADHSELPPFLKNLVPLQNVGSLNAIADSIAQKIDDSKEKIQLSLKQKAALPTEENYRSFADAVKKGGFLDGFDKSCPFDQDAPLHSHITADRLREICADIKQYKPVKSPSDTYKIDLSRIPSKFAVNIRTKAPEAETHSPSSTATTTIEDAGAAQITSEEPVDIIEENSTSVISEEEISTVTNNSEISDNINQSSQTSEQHISAIQEGVQNKLEQLPQVVEQAFFNAAVAQQTGDPSFNHSTADTIKQYSVEVAETFDGITSMMTDFANQLSEAIIESQAYRLPTLSEALQNDPRAVEDQELLDFVSFLESPDNTDDSPELDNDELAAAFGSLLDQLND